MMSRGTSSGSPDPPGSFEKFKAKAKGAFRILRGKDPVPSKTAATHGADEDPGFPKEGIYDEDWWKGYVARQKAQFPGTPCIGPRPSEEERKEWDAAWEAALATPSNEDEEAAVAGFKSYKENFK